jgi:hypothetical protein
MTQRKHLLKALLIIFILFGFSRPVLAQTSTVVSIEPASLEVDPGESFSVDVVVTDVTDLWAFEVAIEYDENVIEFDHCDPGGFLDEGIPSIDVSEPGRAHCGMTQVSDRSELKSGSGILCTFFFIAGEDSGETYLELFAYAPEGSSSVVGLVNGISYMTIPVIEEDGFVQVGEPKEGMDVFIPLMLFNSGKN